METVINNGKTNAIVVKEDTEIIKKMWNGIVNLKVKANQVMIKGTPIVFGICSIFFPEAAPALLPLAAFFCTNTGKKLLSFMMKTEEIGGDVLKGDVSTAYHKVDEGLDNMINDDVDIEDVVKDVGVITKGM